MGYLHIFKNSDGMHTNNEKNHTQKNHYTDKNEIFLIFKEIQMGAGAKSYIRKGFLIYEEMREYLTIYEEAVSLI
jgi:hypothetical protein